MAVSACLGEMLRQESDQLLDPWQASPPLVGRLSTALCEAAVTTGIL